MSHPDEESLVGFALGEPAPEVEAHVAGCAQCRESVASTRTVAHALEQAALDPVVLERPPPEVWLGVQRETAARSATEPGRRGRRRAPAVVAGLVGLLVGVAAGVGIAAVSGRDDRAASDRVREVAAGTLEPLPGQTASGSIRLYRQAGHSVVRIHVARAAADGGFVEAWLLEPGTARMIALGILTRTTQEFEVPADVDLSVYRAVDISAEPLDGDPAHSTASLARGTFPR